MKPTIILIVTILVICSHSTPAQTLEIGTGIDLDEKIRYDTPIVLDSIVFYGWNYNGSHSLVFAVRYTYPVSKGFDLSLGFQTHGAAADLRAQVPDSNIFFAVGSSTLAGLTEFEFPITGRYTLANESGFELQAFAGIIPIAVKVDFETEPYNPDYPASIAEGLNKAGTLPKRFHMDYLVGGRLSYWRINLDVYYQSNITGNLNNNLEIWGHEFLFRRRTEHVRLLLSYSIPLGPKE